MASNIEKLLRLAADYHNFCNDQFAEGGTQGDDEELSIEELEIVAAAAAVPLDEDFRDPFKKLS